MASVGEHMIFSLGVYGHFALGTLSKTYLKDIVFEINVFRRNETYCKIQKVNVDTKTKVRIVLRYYVV